MASPNREELYRMALTAAKKGQRKPAKVMLQQLISQDEKHFRAMMLMAKISGPTERRKWLNHILSIDPDYDDALDALEQMAYQSAARRNKMIYRYGLVLGAVVIFLFAVLIIVSAAATPI